MNDELVMPDHISPNCKDLLTKVNQIKNTKTLIVAGQRPGKTSWQY
jgi:hypothetical protein